MENIHKIKNKQKDKFFISIKDTCKVREVLSKLVKDDLNNIRKSLEIKGISQLKKQDLIDELEKSIVNKLEYIFNEKLNSNHLNYICEMINNNGIIKFHENLRQEVCCLKKLGIAFPVILENGEKVIIIPEDLRNFIKQILSSGEEKNDVKMNAKWIKTTKGILHYYGVLNIEDAYNMVKRLSKEKIDFYEYTMNMQNLENESYVYDKENAVLYLKEVKEPIHIFNEQKKNKELEYYPITIDMVNKASKDVFTKFENDFYNLLIKEYGLNSFEATKVIKICVEKIKNNYYFKDILECFFQFINFKSSKQANKFVNSVQKLYDNTRMWVLKGYSESEKIQLQKGLSNMNQNSNKYNNKKKIGRNDPCPCGSGKKYKKCCGR
ncbi:SEC-C metal-binding domain-containing protein [Haloimpatiens sp. FM7330]|uniref:SEC-C metal-binding domain-containing protein n=1 Tax=Haloimpatiens sp. FM7330 TaxID=3298610 RepID=UPI00363B8E1F